ncbi:MAG: nucleoside phosphorylase [Halobacteria archaeon]
MVKKQPHLLLSHGEINDTVLLPGDPDRVEKIADHLDESEVVSENREYKVANGYYDGDPVSVCSTGVGCPSAAVAVEELEKIGAQNLIRVGTAGALQSDLKKGDVVIGTASGKFDGTTDRYEDVEIPAVADFNVVHKLIHNAQDRGDEVHVGPIVTDDAFYAEDEIAYRWSDANVLAVEMEAAVIFTLARRKNLSAGAIVAIDGNLVAGEQKGETSGEEELPEQARKGVDKQIEIALEAVKEL